VWNLYIHASLQLLVHECRIPLLLAIRRESVFWYVSGEGPAQFGVEVFGVPSLCVQQLQSDVSQMTRLTCGIELRCA
jgi:hypothetical protein